MKPTFGHWLQAVREKNLSYLASEFGQKAALTTQTGTQGGFAVPEQFIPKLMRAIFRNFIRSRCTHLDMASSEASYPVLNHTTTPTAGETAFFGGIIGHWIEEGQPPTETEPTFQQGKLKAHELVAYTVFSDAWLEDLGPGLDTFLFKLFGNAISWFQTYAFLNGNGVGKPVGVTKSQALKTVNRQTANSFTIQDAGQMLAALLPDWDPETTCWAVNPTVFEKLIQLAASSAGLIQLVPTRRGAQMHLFGLPVASTEALPVLGQTGDVLLCDWAYYVVGDRGDLEIAYSNSGPNMFTNRKGQWRVLSRVDGQPWLRDKITLSDATTTRSPFVYLLAA